MIASLTRREAMAVAVVALLGNRSDVDPQAAIDMIAPEEWAEICRDMLPGWAGELAEMERNGQRDERPEDWGDANYMGGMEFRPGITLLWFVCSRQSGAHWWLTNTKAGLEQYGYGEPLAVGWSQDRCVWAAFVIGDSDELMTIFKK